MQGRHHSNARALCAAAESAMRLLLLAGRLLVVCLLLQQPWWSAEGTAGGGLGRRPHPGRALAQSFETAAAADAAARDPPPAEAAAGDSKAAGDEKGEKGETIAHILDEALKQVGAGGSGRRCGRGTAVAVCCAAARSPAHGPARGCSLRLRWPALTGASCLNPTRRSSMRRRRKRWRARARSTMRRHAPPRYARRACSAPGAGSSGP